MARLEYFDDLLNYWHELREEAGGAVPTRTQFNPMAVPKLLPFMFIVERQAEEELIVRLVGTALDSITSQPATGANVLDRYGEAEREIHLEMYANILGQPAGVRLERLIHLAPDPCLHVEALHLPLAGRDGTNRYCVGIIRARRHHGPEDGQNLHEVLINYIDLGFGVPGGD